MTLTSLRGWFVIYRQKSYIIIHTSQNQNFLSKRNQGLEMFIKNQAVIFELKWFDFDLFSHISFSHVQYLERLK